MHALASALLVLVFLLAGPALRPLAAAEGWVPVGPPGGPVPHLVVHPKNPRLLWAGTPSGVFRSVDGGVSWQLADPGLARPEIQALAVAPSAPRTVYLAAGPAGVFRTTDGGETWTAMLPCQQRPLPCCGCIPLARTWVLLVHARNPSTVFAGTTRGLFRSTDGGARWGQTGPKTTVYALVADARDPNLLYAGAGDGLYRSRDGGVSWSRWGSGLPLFAPRLAIDPVDSRKLWALSTGGVFRSTNGGASWRNVADIPAVDLAVASSGQGREIVVLGTTTGALRSTDGGRTWRPAREGLLGQSVDVVVSHPDRPGTFWLGTGPNRQPFIRGIYKSENGGAAWSFSSRGLFNEPGVALAFDPVQPGVLWAGSPAYRVRRSPDGGATWRDRSGDLPRFEAFRVNDLEADPSDAQTLWAGTSRGVWITEDLGLTWESRSDGITPASAPGHKPVQILRVAAADPSVAVASNLDGLFRTVDQARHWVHLPTPFLPLAVVEDVLIDPQDPNVIFAAAEGLWVSRDGGATWAESPVGDDSLNPRTLAADPRDPDVLYLAGDGEIHQSGDGGQTWLLVATLPLGPQAALAVSPTGEIWASGQEGVWSSPDGLTWTLVPGVPLPVTAIEVAPHAPHSAFAATPQGFYRFTKGN